MRVVNPLSSFWRKLKLWRKSKKLARFHRTPRVFVPTGSRWWIVIPYKPIGIILIIFLLATTVYLLFRSDVFLVRDLEVTKVTKVTEVTEAELVDEDEIRTILSSYLARSIFFTKSSEIEKKLLAQFLSLEKVKVEKILPNKIKVGLFEREPLAVLKIRKTEIISETKKLEYEQFFLVDKQGLIFAQVVKKPNLPEFELKEVTEVAKVTPLLGSGQAEVVRDEILGRKIEIDLVQSALKIVEGFNTLGFVKPISFVIGENEEIIVTTDAGWQALFEGKTDPEVIEEKIASLQAIVTKLKIEERSFKKIDLRFKRPVVVY